MHKESKQGDRREEIDGRGRRRDELGSALSERGRKRVEGKKRSGEDKAGLEGVQLV